MHNDMLRRQTWARVDNISRRVSVTAARRFMYEDHVQVGSTYVENLLKEKSYVPTSVCNIEKHKIPIFLTI